MNKVLNENEQLLEQVISKDTVNILVNSSVNNAYETVHECKKCLKLETELQKDFIKNEIYDKLFKSYTTLEKHCISLEVDTQLNHELFQRDKLFSQQSALSFDQLFAINELNAQSQEKYMVIKKLKERIKSLSGNIKEDKIKKELEEIETINIELDHRSAENYDLNASLQEKVFVITALKDNLRKLKRKNLVDDVVPSHPIDTELLKVDVAPLALKLRNNRTVHSNYLRYIQQETATLREIVEQGRSLNPLNTYLDYACNTKKDKIQQTLSSTKKNKIEAYPRTIRSSLINKNCAVKPKETASVQHSKLNVNSNLQCVTCNGCLFSDNHDSCVLDFINNVNARVKSKSVKKTVKRKVWKPKGKVFTNIGYIWRPTDNGTEFVNQTLHEYYEHVGISHETSVARSSQQNNVIERRNRTLIKVARTTLIYTKASLFLWAEAVTTACYTQNRSIVRLHHRKTSRIIKTIHVDFDELTSMASEHSSSRPALHEMTPATISSGLVPNPPSSTSFKPPSKTDWDILFQPLFDELLILSPSVDHPAPEVIALIPEVGASEPAASTGSPSSTTVDQDASSPSNSQSTLETQPPIIPNDVKEDNHDIKVAHMCFDLYFGIPILEVPSDQSSSPARLKQYKKSSMSLNVLKYGSSYPDQIRVSLLPKKVEAIPKSSWTEKDQIDNFLKERISYGVWRSLLKDSILQAGNPVKDILLKLNLPDHRILKDRGKGT
nr:putative ribonuclease H-like domain-containing protein [Tanacetum cinerariifolium]